MTDSEFSTFAKRLFTAFPDVWEWMNANSPNPTGTQEVWRDVLRQCSFQECMHVLDDWLSGKRVLFKPYERSQVAILIRQSVYFDRDKAARRNFAQGEKDAYVKTKRGEYRSAMEGVPGLADVYRKGLELRRRMIDGEITEEQMREEQRRLIDSVQ